MNGISLVMATLGRVAEVERCIESLARQTSKAFELIVVDQNPDDRLVPILESAKQHGFSVFHHRQSEPNQCIARNFGIEQARYDLVAFPDDDCWYDSGVVEQVIERMTQSDCPGCLAIRWAEQDPSGQKRHVISALELRRFRAVGTSMIVLFFRRDLLSAVGYFDPALGLHSWFGGAEETDLIFRIAIQGTYMVYEPGILVHHPFHAVPNGTVGMLFRRYRSRARGTGALYVKHHLEPFVISRGFFMPWVYMVKNLHRPPLAAKYLGVALGRLEGYIRWYRQKKS